MDHIGIDVHKVESQICILTESGEIIERRIRTQRERFAAVLGARPPAKILIESSTESEWVARCLEGLGHEVIVADPNFAAMYATRSRKVKTDRRDARTLAEACRLGAYRPAHRASDQQRRVRARLAVRETLVRTRARYISLVGALLRAEGIRVTSGAAEGFVRRVGQLAVDGQLKSEIAPLLATMLQLNKQVAWLDSRLEHLAKTDETVARLCSAPSVGPVTAAAFASTIDEPQRFSGAHQAEAYLGLVPSEMSSGERQRKGGITKAGNGRMRSLLVQVALSILRLRSPRTEVLRAWAERIAARRGKKIAVVALARRMAGILYAMMRDGKPYQPAGPKLAPQAAQAAAA
jgi:transposase